ncbi:hypothetical protein NQ317_006111 [Molorchus minor]|uniref:Uncharacterized protein n=1 Tax=Molorchus minor TaxID=1323400 RepID=A0ABQ9J0G4_9CUCU|nr:hypothetical protein NQ317_006111 [Molorchus minor]
MISALIKISVSVLKILLADVDCKTNNSEKDSPIRLMGLTSLCNWNLLGVEGEGRIKVPVSSMELVQEIHQLLMDREDTCHRTCFLAPTGGQHIGQFRRAQEYRRP